MATKTAALVRPLARHLRLAPSPAASSPTMTTPTVLLRCSRRPWLPRRILAPAAAARAAHSIPSPPPSRPGESERSSYQITFTCVPCGHRSHHNVSKQAYHHGSTLITCPGCRNRHVISDHLKIFGDRNITVEDLMREKGQLVKRGSLGEDGDIEFWPDDRDDAGSAS